MKAFFVGLWSAFVSRVFSAWRSTLIGFALAAGVLVLDSTVTALQTLPHGWAQIVATLVALVGAALKKKAASYPGPQPVPPAQP